MPTIRDITSDTRMLLKQLSDDSKLTSKFLYSFLKDNRNLLIKREQDKGKLFNSSAIQTIGLFPMVNTDIADTCAVQLGYNISKSKFKLPSPLDLADGSRAIKIYTIDNGKLIEFTSIDKVVSNIDRKYKYPGLTAFISNDYLYINKPDIKGLKLYGIWGEPERIDDLNKCIEYDCNGLPITCLGFMMDKEFNIPDYLENAVKTKTADDILRRFGIIQADNKNNALDDTKLLGKP